jgi:hypothetical protein
MPGFASFWQICWSRFARVDFYRIN